MAPCTANPDLRVLAATVAGLALCETNGRASDQRVWVRIVSGWVRHVIAGQPVCHRLRGLVLIIFGPVWSALVDDQGVKRRVSNDVTFSAQQPKPTDPGLQAGRYDAALVSIICSTMCTTYYACWESRLEV